MAYCFMLGKAYYELLLQRTTSYVFAPIIQMLPFLYKSLKLAVLSHVPHARIESSRSILMFHICSDRSRIMVTCPSAPFSLSGHPQFIALRFFVKMGRPNSDNGTANCDILLSGNACGFFDMDAFEGICSKKHRKRQEIFFV